MHKNKLAGVSNWYHPASLTSSARYANGSACTQALQAAYGLLACSWHDATGGSQAECFRWLWTGTGVEGISEDFVRPLWALGLAGVFSNFQEAQGTGYYMVKYHCKVTEQLLQSRAGVPQQGMADAAQKTRWGQQP